MGANDFSPLHLFYISTAIPVTLVSESGQGAPPPKRPARAEHGRRPPFADSSCSTLAGPNRHPASPFPTTTRRVEGGGGQVRTAGGGGVARGGSGRARRRPEYNACDGVLGNGKHEVEEIATRGEARAECERRRNGEAQR